MLKLVATLLLLAVVSIDAFELDNPAIESRYKELIADIRCPKCPNTNLAGSDAPISADLRRLVHTMLHEGKTDQEIRNYLRERYGEFVLYDPPLSPATLALWVVPLIGVLIVAYIFLSHRNVGYQDNELSSSE